MEISDDAREVLEGRVARILRSIDIPDSDKGEIRQELLSNYTDASIVKARNRGAEKVDGSDARSALADSEDPDEIASMYMVSYTEALKRAGIVPRSIAFIIDYAAASFGAFILTTPFMFLGMFLQGPPGQPPVVPFMMQYMNMILTLNLAIVFIYFVVSESFFGFTPGKWLLGLKVVKADGRKVGYTETIVRNISKVLILAIMADALMIPVSREAKQRLFDRIAGTIVIHRN